MYHALFKVISTIVTVLIITGCDLWDGGSGGASNLAPTASSARITDSNGGNAVEGDRLTGEYTYSDSENDSEGTTTFRWLRDGTAIRDATSSSYTLVAADVGTSIAFEVTPIASTGTTIGAAVTSSSILAIANLAPTASSVSITDVNGGNAIVSDSLTSNYTYSDTESDAEGTSTFRWLRDGSAISGATLSSYTLVSADFGKTITFEVTPVASTGTALGSAATSAGLIVSNTTTATVTSTKPKTFTFNWADIGAAHYELQKNPDGSSGFSQVGANIAGTTVDELISVHTHDWDNALYLIESCDASDSCGSSNTLTTDTLELDAIGYIKPSDTSANRQFGSLVTSSSDGTVFATIGSRGGTDDVYIYRYDTGTGWSEELISDIPTGNIWGLSISGDGNVIAVGSTQDNAYIYKYTTTWTLEYTIPTPVSSVTFGFSVALSKDGRTLAVSDKSYNTNGAVYVYIDDLDGTWSLRGSRIEASDATSNLGAGVGSNGDGFGEDVTLSSDGTTLAVGAVYAETATATDAGQAYVYSWSGASWTEDDILSASTPANNERFGHSLSLSDDGATLAVGRNPQGSDGETHIFRDSSGWALQGSPLEPDDGNGNGFGHSVALSSDGNTVLIGAYTEDTSGAGIDPTPDTGLSDSGAAFLFEYGGSSWSQSSFIKSPNVNANDRFGYSLDMSADASTLVISAYLEDSNSTGINSSYNNDGSADNSGAIYLY